MIKKILILLLLILWWINTTYSADIDTWVAIDFNNWFNYEFKWLDWIENWRTLYKNQKSYVNDYWNVVYNNPSYTWFKQSLLTISFPTWVYLQIEKWYDDLFIFLEDIKQNQYLWYRYQNTNTDNRNLYYYFDEQYFYILSINWWFKYEVYWTGNVQDRITELTSAEYNTISLKKKFISTSNSIQELWHFSHNYLYRQYGTFNDLEITYYNTVADWLTTIKSEYQKFVWWYKNIDVLYEKITDDKQIIFLLQNWHQRFKYDFSQSTNEFIITDVTDWKYMVRVWWENNVYYLDISEMTFIESIDTFKWRKLFNVFKDINGNLNYSYIKWWKLYYWTTQQTITWIAEETPDSQWWGNWDEVVDDSLIWQFFQKLKDFIVPEPSLEWEENSVIKDKISEVTQIDDYIQFWDFTLPSDPSLIIELPKPKFNEYWVLYVDNEMIQTELSTINDNLNITTWEKSIVWAWFISLILAILYLIVRFIILTVIFFIPILLIKKTKFISRIFLWWETSSWVSWNAWSSPVFIFYILALITTLWSIFAIISPSLLIFNVTTDYITAFFTFLAVNFWSYTIFYLIINTFSYWLSLSVIAYTTYVVMKNFFKLN